MNDQQISELLLKENYISEQDLARAKQTAVSSHISLVEALLTEHLLTHDLLGQAIAESYGLAYADLSSTKLPADQILT